MQRLIYRHEKWYASITVQCEPVRAASDGAVGIDFGVLTAISLSDGTRIENPRHLATSQEKVKQASKQKRRKRAPNRKKKVKASKRWRKAQKRVSKLTRKVSRQRMDWIHKTTAQIVSRNSLVVGEKLNIKGMTRKAKKGKRKRQKAGLNRSILDVGMGAMAKMLEYKEAEAGGFYLESPTQSLKPSQRCPSCWQVKPKTLDQRVHQCECGCIEDRDVAAARVNLIWGMGTVLPERGSQASTSTPQATGGWKQAWEKKRQKPPVA